MRTAKTATTRSARALVAFAVVTSLFFAEANARTKSEPYALIFGTVYDAENHPVAGVKVKIARLKGEKRDQTWDHVSDGRGEFAQRVPAGRADYLVCADVKSKKNKEPRRAEVKVHVENDERQDISLHLRQ